MTTEQLHLLRKTMRAGWKLFKQKVSWPLFFFSPIWLIILKKHFKHFWERHQPTTDRIHHQSKQQHCSWDLLYHYWGSCWCSARERVPPAGLPAQCGTPAAQPATGPSEPGSSPSPSSDWTAALHTHTITNNAVIIKRRITVYYKSSLFSSDHQW